MSTLTITRNEVSAMIDVADEPQYSVEAFTKLVDLRAYFRDERACWSVDYAKDGGMDVALWGELVAIKGEALARDMADWSATQASERAAEAAWLIG